MTDKPIILLDIDGVLNTFPATPKHMWDEFQEHLCTDMVTGKEFRLIMAQAVIDFVNEMWVSGDVDIRWHTTWQSSSIEVAKAFGIAQDIPIQDAPEFDRWNRGKAQGWWKLWPTQRALFESDGPVIWIDDDAGAYWVDKLHKQCVADGMLAQGRDYRPRLTTICPDPQTGLSKAHLRKIRNIINDWKNSKGDS